MQDKIKTYSNKKYLDKFFQNEFDLVDKNAHVYLYLKSKDELFDSRTRGKQLSLNPIIYKYIDDKTSMLDNDIKINLHITCPGITNKEEEQVKHIMKEFYAVELYKIQKTYARHRNKTICLILIGIISFIMYIALYSNGDFAMFKEIFAFLFTFSLWLAIESLIYELSDTRYEVGNVTQNLLIDVEFIKEINKI